MQVDGRHTLHLGEGDERAVEDGREHGEEVPDSHDHGSGGAELGLVWLVWLGSLVGR